jgi:hypothetical protein
MLALDAHAPEPRARALFDANSDQQSVSLKRHIRQREKWLAIKWPAASAIQTCQVFR